MGTCCHLIFSDDDTPYDIIDTITIVIKFVLPGRIIKQWTLVYNFRLIKVNHCKTRYCKNLCKNQLHFLFTPKKKKKLVNIRWKKIIVMYIICIENVCALKRCYFALCIIVLIRRFVNHSLYFNNYLQFLTTHGRKL